VLSVESMTGVVHSVLEGSKSAI